MLHFSTNTGRFLAVYIQVTFARTRQRSHPSINPNNKPSRTGSICDETECFYAVRHNCLQDVNMSEIFSVRIPRELKEKIEQNPADWSQEVRNFLTERVKQMELLKTLDEIETRAEKRTTKIDSVTLIRKDRERQN